MVHSKIMDLEEADLLLHNGIVITMDSLQPYAEALAIQGERIVWVGANKDSVAWIGPKTKIIDLKGASAYPGFIDTHAHIVYTGLAKQCVQLAGSQDKQEVLERVQERVQQCHHGEWIVGVGWDDAAWPVKAQTVLDLDVIAPNNPVVLRRTDSHAIWVNSAVLKIAGIDAQTPDVDGGKIVRDPYGNPTGLLVDNAMVFVKNCMPKINLEEAIQLTEDVLQESLRLGLTMIHNASMDETELKAFQILASQNALPVRIYTMEPIRDASGSRFLELGPQNYGAFLEVNCLKFFVDGAFGSRGAALFEPYHDEPEHCGLLLWEERDILPYLFQAKEKGFQVAVHAIGDMANNHILDLYEKVGVKGLRWRVEHAQLLKLGDIPRFAELGIIAAMQPIHATSDMVWFEERVGPHRIKEGAFVLRSLLDHGTMIVGGSDAPIEDINPLWGMYAAVTRQNHKGFPKAGWYPEQRVTREEALKMYTIDAAFACFREHELGSLTPGKLADIVILPENILTCPMSDLIDMEVLYTIVNGEVRFTKQPQSQNSVTG